MRLSALSPQLWLSYQAYYLYSATIVAMATIAGIIVSVTSFWLDMVVVAKEASQCAQVHVPVNLEHLIRR